jgi:hypothetical protein
VRRKSVVETGLAPSQTAVELWLAEVSYQAKVRSLQATRDSYQGIALAMP